MDILFLTENFPPETNAAATRVYERARYWAAWGHSVTVVTCAPNFPDGKLFAGYTNRWRQEETLDGMRIVRVKTFIARNQGVARRSLDFLSFGLTGGLAALGLPRPDVIVATSPQFFAAVAGWMVGKMRRVPFVFELGDLWPASISAVGAMRSGFALRALERLELRLYCDASCVVALTDAFKRNLVSRGIRPEKIAVVINGVDLPRYAPRPRDEELAAQWQIGGCFTAGYLGTLGMAHGLEHVLNAAHHLRGRPDIRIVLAGAGAERERLIAKAADEGLDNVRILPAHPKSEMPRLWSLLDVALIHLRSAPAFADVIPSKMFEAMAMGLPILLAAPAGEAKTILLDDGAGLWVAPENPAMLAAAICQLADDAALRGTLAKSSLSAARRHTRERQAHHMLAVLQAAAAGEGATAANTDQAYKSTPDAIAGIRLEAAGQMSGRPEA
jgi:colanic acid biosynthesis glycosyl transferase WcaI